MKRFSLILSILLLGIMLVSCGTTLKKTSDKGSFSEVALEQTKKPGYINVWPNGSSSLEFSCKIGSFESNSRVYIEIKEKNNPESVVLKRDGQADAEGAFNFTFTDFHLFGVDLEITITAQAPGKVMSEPLIINENFK